MNFRIIRCTRQTYGYDILPAGRTVTFFQVGFNLWIPVLHFLRKANFRKLGIAISSLVLFRVIFYPFASITVQEYPSIGIENYSLKYSYQDSALNLLCISEGMSLTLVSV